MKRVGQFLVFISLFSFSYSYADSPDVESCANYQRCAFTRVCAGCPSGAYTGDFTP